MPRASPAIKVAIGAAVVALTAGGTWLAVSPSSPFRSGPGVPPAATGEPVTATDGALTVTAEVHDRDLVWTEEIAAAGVRRAVDTTGHTDPPIHAGTRAYLTMRLTASGPVVISSIEGAGSCQGDPDRLEADTPWDFDCLLPEDPDPGTKAVDLTVVSSDGTVTLHVEYDVVGPPSLELHVDGPVSVQSGQPFTVTGTVTNSSRIALDLSYLVIPLSADCESVLVLEGDPFPAILPGETVAWSCDAGVAGLPGTYGPMPASLIGMPMRGAEPVADASTTFTYVVTEAETPSPEWRELCDLMQEHATVGAEYTTYFERWDACADGRRDDPQCWPASAPAGEDYTTLWMEVQPRMIELGSRVAAMKREYLTTIEQEKAFMCFCQPQLVQVLGVEDDGDPVIGIDPDAVATYCEDGLPFGTPGSVPDE